MSQLSLAIKAKELGISRVRAKNSVFVETGRGIARMLCRRYGKGTAMEVRKELDARGLKPTHFNAYGAIWSTKEFECIGTTRSTLEQGHSNEIKVWRLRSESVT